MRVYGYSDARECANASRYLANRSDSMVAPGRALDQRLASLSRRYPGLLVIPTTDRHVEYLSRSAWASANANKMAGCYSSGAALRALDKESLSGWAVHAGISQPRALSAAAIRSEMASLEFPLLLKPRSIHRHRNWLKGRKLFVCKNLRQLERRLDDTRIVADEWTVQELIPGPESEIVVVAAYRNRSGAVHTFSARKLRQYPPGFGSASLLVSHRDAKAADAAAALLQAAEFNGIAGIEFKRDPRDGKLKLIEMNPRPSLWFSSATGCGEYLVHRQLEDFGLIETSKRSGPGRVDRVLWRYGFKDWYSAIFYKFKRVTGLPNPDSTVGRGYRKTWAIWDRRDKAPFFAELMQYARKAIQRVLR